MIQQRNKLVWLKINGLIRLIMLHLLSNKLPLYIVNEYPKSGGSWLSQMISEAIEVPFPRNRLPMLCSSVMHGHYLRPGFMKNVVVLWRDGRDVLISQYYHSLFKNEKGNSILVDITRSHIDNIDYTDISSNLLDFIEYTYTKKVSPKFSWIDFYRFWGHKDNAIHVKYEDLLKYPEQELRRIVQILSRKNFDINRAKTISDKYSFKSQTGRLPGQEDKSSFLRKGIVGDWKNHFTPEAKKLFAEYAGDALIGLGYEKDDSWIRQ